MAHLLRIVMIHGHLNGVVELREVMISNHFRQLMG